MVGHGRAAAAVDVRGEGVAGADSVGGVEVMEAIPTSRVFAAAWLAHSSSHLVASVWIASFFSRPDP